MSSFVRFGGSGGNVVGSKTGAFTLPASIEGVLEPGVLAVPFESADIDETVEMVEETDSIEAFLLSCSEGLLGGKAGDGCVDCFRAGSLGATTGFPSCGTACPVRTIFVGGGSTPSLLDTWGSLPMRLLDTLLCPKAGGRFVDWLL